MGGGVFRAAAQPAQPVWPAPPPRRRRGRARRVVHDDVAVLGGGARARRQHGFRRAFDGEQESVAVAVDRRHHFAGRVEGVLARERMRDGERVAGDAGEAAGAQQR